MNRKCFVSFLICVMLLLAVAVPVSAAGAPDYVIDEAGLFTDSQKEALAQKAEAISREYDFGVYIVVLDNFKHYGTTSNVERFTMDFYDSNNYGKGSDRAGVMLLLSMADRDYDLDFYSDRADYAFTEAGRDRMIDRFLSHFHDNAFYSGFDVYLNTCDSYLQAARNGTPVGEGEHSSADEDSLLFLAPVIGAAAALITGVMMSAPMHSAKAQTDANQYIAEGGFNLTRRSDMFLHRSVTRVRRETSNSSGSSHHYSSGGHSGRSGKF